MQLLLANSKIIHTPSNRVANPPIEHDVVRLSYYSDELILMSKEKNLSICPVERSGGLDNRLRRWLQNPQKIVMPYIKPGMTVLDLGCGPGFFAVEIARLLNDSGKVIAADLQQGMLDKVSKKVKGTESHSQTGRKYPYG